MKRLNLKIFNKWIGLFIASVIIFLSIGMINNFVNRLKKQELQKVKNYAAVQRLSAMADENTPPEILNFYFEYLSTIDIPIIMVDEKDQYIDSRNIDSTIIDKPDKIRAEILSMQKKYEPITIQLPYGVQKIYYKNSKVLDDLQYYPVIFIAVAAFLGLFGFWYYQTNKNSEQNYLWAGMAKETAHQIGTPLSSLLGWVELLKTENLETVDVIEIEKDISRLSTIAERFSKIGSTPELKTENVVEVTRKSYLYLINRLSKKVDFQFHATQEHYNVQLSAQLYNWVIENLVKNAVDAMQGEGKLAIKIFEQNEWVVVSIKDNGSGMKKSVAQKIFTPGFTTKKRGWGLGLSLAKRIIEEYHKGKIYVYKTEIGEGTEFRIMLRKIK